MIRIRNRLDQPLVVNRGKGRVLHLLADGSAVITDEELAAPEIQALLAEGALEQRQIHEQGTPPTPDEAPPRRRKDG